MDRKGKKPAKKKEPFKLSFEEKTEAEFEKYFKETRASTTLTKATLVKYSKSNTTLPDDLHYNMDTLFQLFSKPKVLVSLKSEEYLG